MLNRVIAVDEGLLILGLVEGDLPHKFKLSGLRIVELDYQQGRLIRRRLRVAFVVYKKLVFNS